MTWKGSEFKGHHIREQQLSLSIHWLHQSKVSFYSSISVKISTFVSMSNTLHSMNSFLPNRFIFNVANIKSLSDCRFPEDGQDLLYSFSVLAMRPIIFLSTEDLVIMDAKKLSHRAGVMDISSHIAGRRRHKQRKLRHLQLLTL